jgi:hypothetical protein
MREIEVKLSQRPYEIPAKNIYFGIPNKKGEIVYGFSGCRGYLKDSIGRWLRDGLDKETFEKDFIDIFIGSEKDLLAAYIPNIEALINNICKNIGFKDIEFLKVTNITSAKDEYFVLRIDRNWVMAPFMISFLLLCVRNLALNYNGEDLVEFFENHKKNNYKVKYDNIDFKNGWIERDVIALNNAHGNIINFIKYGPIPFMSLDAKKNYNLMNMHNYGMTEFSNENEKSKERKFIFSKKESDIRKSIIIKNTKVLS